MAKRGSGLLRPDPLSIATQEADQASLLACSKNEEAGMEVPKNPTAIVMYTLPFFDESIVRRR